MNLMLDKSKTYVVGYSTGVDSTALLHYLKQHNYKVRAICVKHYVNNEFTNGINEQIAKELCTQLDIDLTILTVNFSSVNGGFEHNARIERYSAIAKNLLEHEIFLTGHHNDDLVETVFLQMLRGTGLKGLSGIKPEQSLVVNNHVININRPLLKIAKAELIAYAVNNNLKWYEDVTNEDDNIKRNFLRLNIFPLLKEKYAHLNKNITRLTEYMQEADRNLMDLAEIDINSVQLSDLPLITKWDKQDLKKLSKDRISNLIRYFFKKKYNLILSENEYHEIFKRVFSVRNESVIQNKVKLSISHSEISFEKIINPSVLIK